MDTLRNLKVGSRLAIGFGLVLLLIAAILAVVLYGNRLKSDQFQYLTNVNMVKMRLLNDMLDINNAVIRDRRLMLLKRGDGFAQDQAQLHTLAGRYDEIWQRYVKIPRDAVGDRMVAEIEAARSAASASTKALDGFMEAGDFDAAVQVLLTEQASRAIAWNDTLSALLKHQEVLTRKSSDEYNAIESWTGKLSLGIGLLSLVLGALLALLITRSLTRPLGIAVGVANGIAGGRLDNSIDVSGKDEVADLLRAMQHMQRQVQSVIAAQGEMARQHEAGTISYRIDASPFAGDYRRMIEESNALVGQHIDVKLRVIEVMKRYARGDLSVDMDRLPGEKAAITQAMDETKASLSAIRRSMPRSSAWPVPRRRVISACAATRAASSTTSATWWPGSTA